jgi:hypothetical protein
MSSQKRMERMARLGCQIMDLCEGYTHAEIQEVLKGVSDCFRADELGIAERLNAELREDGAVNQEAAKLLALLERKQ